MAPGGFTLIETLIGVGLLVSGVAVLLFGMHFAMIHAEYLSQMQVARQAAQGLLERIQSLRYNQILAQFPQAMVPNQGQPCFLEDLNCNSYNKPINTIDVIGGVSEDRNKNGRLDSLVLGDPRPYQDVNGNGKQNAGDQFGAALIVQVRPSAGVPPAFQLWDVHVAACWSHRGRPISEDLNCDGILTPIEDVNGNGWIDSPVMVDTRVGP